jgi:peptidoglycan/LPS O-acetylase OafA/YrhL
MVSVGVLSYSLYLWQQPFLVSQPFLAFLYELPALQLTGVWKIVAFAVVRFAIVGVLAVLSYRLVERPMLSLRTSLEPLLFRPSQPSTIAARPVLSTGNPG